MYLSLFYFQKIRLFTKEKQLTKEEEEEKKRGTRK